MIVNCLWGFTIFVNANVRLDTDVLLASVIDMFMFYREFRRQVVIVS